MLAEKLVSRSFLSPVNLMVWDLKVSRKARKRTLGGGWSFLEDRGLVRLDPLFYHGRCIRGVESEESMIPWKLG